MNKNNETVFGALKNTKLKEFSTRSRKRLQRTCVEENIRTFFIEIVYVEQQMTVGSYWLSKPIFFQSIRTEYDFIIIGAGSAGAVIANRLTEIDEWKVLLLEAGGDENLWGQVPAAAADIQLTERDWQYQTEEMRGQACLGLENQRFYSHIFLQIFK